ncbi:cytoplasmic protein NCK2-like [Biomphalaria glabrata]|uniref:Cytoplasmic protein NCK2-like n=2 Tax=Biomphalaria TaxID=6525 RepID=A0A2C9JF90_BIOGL|nr:cytoplasmic protein NCK2-like [Biomphalaria glabrata]XP_013067659.1 cytoplasmic protein NCK2-like [Biomphalaria glabrata]XP_055868340.1 cytoplasmic protein NCK2-like [Biomphalaria glabrata]XP_055868341.1 cytoplasmic protein NCK2-like [Biomphalaria glabrata]
MAEGQQETQLIAKYDYKAENTQELSMRKGDRLLLVDDTKDWWKVRSPETGKEGFVPSNFVKIVKPKTSLFSTILKKHVPKKKSDTNKPLPSHSSPVLNNGDSIRARPNANNSNITTETYQLGQCVPACAKYFYTAQRADEISLSKGERIMVIEKSSDGWWRGRKDDGSVGWFPSNYVEEVSSGGGNASDSNALYFTAAEARSHSSPSHSSTDIVLALYSFTGKNSGELSFEKGERLEVVVAEPDSDWLSVRNSRGETGVVPANYVTPAPSSGEEGSDRGTSTSSSNPQSQSQSISSISNTSIAALALAGRKQFQVSGPLADKEWYYGKISRNQCEDILTKFAVDGDFLIRDSESTAGHFTVSLKAPGRNKHFRVKNTSGVLEIGQQRFTNLDDLIEHYKKHPIFKQEAEKLYLVKPFICPSSQDN